MRAAWKGLRGCLRISPSPLEALVNDHGKGLLVLPFGYEVWLSRDCDYSLSLKDVQFSVTRKSGRVWVDEERYSTGSSIILWAKKVIVEIQ